MLIWKPPALLILGIGFAVGMLAAYLGTMVLKCITAEDIAKALTLIIWGVISVAGDIVWRRRNGISLFDLSASTLFFVLPTWIVGGALVIGGSITGL